MISCPACGTSNRRGSKFCGQCGLPLEAAPEIGCPECHRLNPSDSIFCAFCGARIVPLQTDSAEASPAPVAEQPLAQADVPQLREVPAWLYGAQETAAEQDGPAVAPETLPEPRPTHTSKYLEDIQGALPETAGWLPVNAQAEPLPKVELPTPITARRQGCLAILPLLLLPRIR